ncbi:IS3 family transposase, partial [Bacillus velezensis]
SDRGDERVKTAEAVQEAVCKYIHFYNHQRFQKK